MWGNPGEDVEGEERNGIDDDGNGFVEDLYGWDFIDDDAAPLADDYHGTSVAGIIGGVGDNALGVAGVNWNVSIVTLRVCDGGCPISAIVDAITYTSGAGADVANMSLGRL